MLFDLFRSKPVFTVELVVHAGTKAGFVAYWDLEAFVFVEYLATSPEHRSQGLGGKTLAALIARSGNKPLVLEVEPPLTQTARSRISFYLRNGFELWEKPAYEQPPYRNIRPAVPMKLMTFGNINLEKDFEKVKNRIYTQVYNVR